VIEHVLTEVGHKQIVVAVVVVVADADALPPPGVRDARFECHVGERAVAIIPEQARDGLLSGGKSFEARAVDEKNIEPAVVVVVIERDSAAGSFEQVFVLIFTAEGGFGVES